LLHTTTESETRPMAQNTLSAPAFFSRAKSENESFDEQALRRLIDLRIAVDHNMRRKLNAIRAIDELASHRFGNGPAPSLLPSACLNPNETAEKTNLYYLFKALGMTPSWDIPNELLIEPYCLTHRLLDRIDRHFPCEESRSLRHLLEELFNTLLLPKLHAEWSDQERADRIARHAWDMNSFRSRFHEQYTKLTIRLETIENPDSAPERKMIRETHETVTKIARSICKKKRFLSRLAQDKALDIWNTYKENLEVKNKYCEKHHRVSYAHVFDYCKRQIMELGIKTPEEFEKAVRAAQKNQKRTTE